MQPAGALHRRLEASAFAWTKLTQRQQEAVEKAATLLLDAVAALDPIAPRRVGALELDRRSQLAFIDGDRGMGKTSVLLSIRGFTHDEADVRGVPDAIRRLHENRARIVWLPTLDMEPLARSTNLFAAILARVGEQLDVPRRGDVPPVAAALDDLDAHELVASDLQRLQADAVLIWDGAERRRAERIDPGAYAAEVLRSERAGLDLNARLGYALERLSALMTSTRRARAPIFVVPVDDFDLAPPRCLELLRIIRMVTTPHLFFLVAGNSRIGEEVLRLQAEGDFAGIAGPHGVDRNASMVRARAIEIAANNMRKLVPPEQRARLEEVRVDEARGLRPAADAPSLDEVLAAIAFDRNNAPDGARGTTLKAFLLPDDAPHPAAYSAAQWLGGTPRQVHDRATALAQLRGEQRDWGEALLRVLGNELRREALEDWHLAAEERELMAQVCEPADPLRFGLRRVLTAAVDEWEWTEHVPFDHGEITARAPGVIRWLLRQRTGEQNREAELPRRLAAGATLLHDLAISLWGGYLRGGSIVYDIDGLFSPVSVRWSVEERSTRVVRWVVPQWWTLREHERFFSRWTSHATRRSSADDLALAWLTAQLEVLLDAPHMPGEVSFARVRQLLAPLVRESPRRFARAYLRSSALVGVALLVAPESGLSEDFSAALLEAGQFRNALLEDEDLAARIRMERAASFARFTAARDPQRRGDGDLVDAHGVALLEAISPERAAAYAWSELERAVSTQLKGLPTRAAAELPRLLSAGATTPEVARKLRTVATSLRKAGLDLLASQVATAARAIGRPMAAHPLNALGRGRLVPGEADVAANRPAKSSWGGGRP